MSSEKMNYCIVKWEYYFIIKANTEVYSDTLSIEI